MITAEQIRTAREMLGLAAGTVTRMANMSKTAYRAAEAGELQLDPQRLGRVKAALERAGVEFASDGCGVSLRSPTSITAEQIRAARKHLGWSYATLARKAGCSLRLAAQAEQVDGAVPETLLFTVFAIQTALEAAGVVFVAEDGDGPGVRSREGA